MLLLLFGIIFSGSVAHYHRSGHYFVHLSRNGENKKEGISIPYYYLNYTIYQELSFTFSAQKRKQFWK